MPDARDFGGSGGVALAERDGSDLAVADLAVDALVIDALEIEVIEAEPILDSELRPQLRPELRPDPRAEPEPDRPRHLRVAPDSVRRRRHVRIAVAAAAVSISATLFAVVGFNVELAQHQIQLQALQQQLQSQQTLYYNYRAEVAQRSSPATIMTLAGRLGLVQATPIPLPAPIVKLPHEDPTGTSNLLSSTSQSTRNSLDPNQ